MGMYGSHSRKWVREHSISPDKLPVRLAEMLAEYARQNSERVDEITAMAIKQLRDITRNTAPRGNRLVKRKSDDGRPHYHTTIATKRIQGGYYGASRYLWYVKSPNYRLTHLLEKDHKGRWGNAVKGRNFIRNALDEVLADYEAAVIRYFGDGI